MYKQIPSLAIAVSLALGGCAEVKTLGTLANGSVPNAPPKAIAELRLAYDTVFFPLALYYKRLPRCPAGVHWSWASECKERAYVVKIQKADKAAEIALNSLQKVSMSGDQISFGVAYVAARQAITDAQALVIIFKKKG